MRDPLLVTIAEQGRTDHARQLLHSAVSKGNWKFDRAIIVSNLDESECQWFLKHRIEIKKFPGILTPISSGYPGYYFALQEMFAEQFAERSRVVYLDPDCLIRQSLDVFLIDTPIVAARHPLHQNIKSLLNPRGICDGVFITTYKSQFAYPCYDTGAFSFSPQDAQIKQGIAQIRKLFELGQNIALMPDMFAINLAFADLWSPLPADSVYFGSFVDYINSGAKNKDINASVLRFTGPEKPWKKLSPYREEWLRNVTEANGR